MKNNLNGNLSCRRYDIDWLRVIAFGVLIYFHAAVAFLPKGLPLILNSQPSAELAIAVAFSHQFRLALLFFVSGCGVYFATRSLSCGVFLRQRAYRLLMPLVFGIVVLVPFMVFLEKRYIGALDVNFVEFYSRYLHHFWFLAYLFLFCVLACPFISWVKKAVGRERLRTLIDRIRYHGYGVYLPILLLLIVEIPLRPIFPGFRNLISDWASFTHWFVIFIAGFIFAFDQHLLQDAARKRTLSLSAAVLVSLLLFYFYWRPEQYRLYPFENDEINVLSYLWFSSLRITGVWLWILVCVGYAARYLNRPGTLVVSLNRAVYPVFCLHLPVLVALEFVFIPMPWPIAVKFLVITSLTIVTLALLYGLLRPVRFIHPFVGMRINNNRKRLRGDWPGKSSAGS